MNVNGSKPTVKADVSEVFLVILCLVMTRRTRRLLLPANLKGGALEAKFPLGRGIKCTVT